MTEETNKLKICMAKIEKDIERLLDNSNKNELAHREIIDKMDVWIEHAEKRFAAKWTEVVLKSVIGLMGSAIILYAMSLILK